MSDEPQLQITLRDEKSSLSLSTVRSGLIARGRQDAEAIARASVAPHPLSETHRLAEAGDADAQFNLGWKYSYGADSSPRNFGEAAQWYRAAAEQGHAEAQGCLGEIYHLGFGGVAEDYAEALRWCHRAADQGNSSGQYELGTMYRDGHGVAQNYAEALAWFQKAADQYHLYALSDLGDMYEKGEGVPTNCTEAGRWYCLAADAAIAALERGLESTRWDIDWVDSALRKGGGYGHADAQKLMVAIYRSYAARGREWDQFELGNLYARGDWGLPQDFVQAHMWLDLAAVAAWNRYRKYPSGGSADAEKYSSALDAVAAKMTPEQIAESRRLALEWKPTTTGEG